MRSLLEQETKKALLIIVIPVPRVLCESGAKNSPLKASYVIRF